MKKAKNTKIELNVELFDRHKKFKIPSVHSLEFWPYIEVYCKTKAELFHVENVGWFFLGSAKELVEIVENDKAIKARNLQWTIKKFTTTKKPSEYSLVDRERLAAVVTCDGQIFIRDAWSSKKFLTVIPTPVLPDERRVTDALDAAYRNFRNDSWVEEGDEYYNPDWALVDEAVAEIEAKLFNESFKKSYNIWLNKQKLNGEYAKYKRSVAAKKMAVKTNRKMAACLQSKKVIDLLEIYVEDITSETATRKQNVEVYKALSELVRSNKLVKPFLKK